jgi:hypothetical protein
MEARLTVKECATLMKCSRQNVLQQIESRKLTAERDMNNRNLPQYFIPLSALDVRLQAKYYEIHKLQVIESSAPDREIAAGKPTDEYTTEQREDIAFWMRLLKEWQEYRNKPGKPKQVRDQEFVAYCSV